MEWQNPITTFTAIFLKFHRSFYTCFNSLTQKNSISMCGIAYNLNKNERKYDIKYPFEC